MKTLLITLWILSVLPCYAGEPGSFFVSQFGSDLSPGTIDLPFKTFERAREAMRHSKIKTTYVIQGIYHRDRSLLLTAEDNGENWLVAPIRSVVIDVDYALPEAILILGGSNIVIDGFVIKNVLYRGIGIHGGEPFRDVTMAVSTGAARNNTVRNTEVLGILAPHIPNDPSFWHAGGVEVAGNVPGTRIISNYFHDSISMGLRIVTSGSIGDDISGSLIEDNVVVRTMQGTKDGGAIYLQDVDGRSRDIRIAHNYIYDFQGTDGAQGRGIYLDRSTSNVEVVNNVIVSGPEAGEGTVAVFVSNGSDIDIHNNVVILGSTGMVVTYAILHYPTGPGTDMQNNRFHNNVVAASFYGNQLTAFLGQKNLSFICGGTISHPPIIEHNLYYNLKRGEERTDGNCSSDVSPVHTDPKLDALGIPAAAAIPVEPILFRTFGAKWPVKRDQLKRIISADHLGIVEKYNRP